MVTDYHTKQSFLSWYTTNSVNKQSTVHAKTETDNFTLNSWPFRLTCIWLCLASESVEILANIIIIGHLKVCVQTLKQP